MDKRAYRDKGQVRVRGCNCGADKGQPTVSCDCACHKVLAKDKGQLASVSGS